MTIELLSRIDLLEKENQRLNKQLDYLRSGEYLNQLKFEIFMLEHIVANGEVSEEDKKFIDMTHRNTQLLEENQKMKEVIDKIIKNIDITIEIIKKQPTGNDDWILKRLDSFKFILGEVK